MLNARLRLFISRLCNQTRRAPTRALLAMALLMLALAGCLNNPAPIEQNIYAPAAMEFQTLLGRDVLPHTGDGEAWQAADATFPTRHAGKPKSPESAAAPPQNEFEGLGDGPLKRGNFFLIQRAFPADSVPAGAFPAAVQAMQNMQPLQAAEAMSAWENIGPAPMLNSMMGQQPVNVSGRVRALAIDPRNSNVVYLGAALGGVWKTTNGGDSWQPLTDGQPSLAAAAITLDPNNPDVVYVGTGEPTPGLDNYYGAGILKSTDGGATWAHLGADVFTGLGIAKIIVDPNNANTVFVAASRAGVDGSVLPPRGIFRSLDGGRSWQALLGCDDCFGASELVMDAGNSSVLYAAFWQYGLFKSTDGGANWAQLAGGLPNPEQYDIGRVMLTISPGNPDVLFASYQLTIPQQYDGAVLFKSVNGGQSWAAVEVGYNYCGTQCWYSHEIQIDPANPNRLLVGGSAFYAGQGEADLQIRQVIIATNDGGQSWFDLTQNTSPDTTLHPDMHVIEFDPANADVIWVGNDGGVWVSTDGGSKWINRNTNLATLQFTGIAVDPTNSDIIQGGMQDNNKAYTTNGGANPAWTAADRGDGGFAAIDPFNPSIWYGTRFNRTFQRNDQGAAFSGDWPFKTDGIDQQDPSLFYIPIAVDPSSPGVVYLGTYRVYRSADRGENWGPISGSLSTTGQGYVSAITVAPSDSRTVYAGTSDGVIQVTRNNGGSWQNITGPILPNRYVSRIAVSPSNPQLVYAVYNGFDTHTPSAPGHIFRSSNGGASWQNISANLPDVPGLSLVLDPAQSGVLYLGTDTGVYRSANDGQRWTPFNNGLPYVAVVDLALSGDGRYLFAGTHGRSVFRVALEPGAGGNSVFLPSVRRQDNAASPTPTSAATPTAAPSATPTPTSIPSATPTATGTPDAPTPAATPIPTSTPDVTVFSDDFNSAGNWEAGIFGSCDVGYGNGVYYIGANEANANCISSAPLGSQDDGVFAVSATTNSQGVYGLVFGLPSPTINANSAFYVFWFDQVGARYSLQKYDQGWTYLTDPLGDGFEATTFGIGSGYNRLKVRHEGAEILLFLNGIALERVTDDSFADGYVGLINSSFQNAATEALFDNFLVNRIRDVFVEPFSNRAGGWFEGADSSCQAAYESGEYVAASRADYICLFRAPTGSQTNGRFTVTARSEESFYPTAYGLFFGEDGSFSDFYAFFVVPESQSYALTKYANGQWYGITWNDASQSPWLYNADILSGMNDLWAERDGNLLRMGINDVYLGAFFDGEPLAGSYMGVILMASQFDGAIARFDDFVITAWDSDPLVSGANALSKPIYELSSPQTMQPLPQSEGDALPNNE